jgi:hypothetical protein
MSENLERPEQDSTKINNLSLSISDPLNSQNLTRLADSPYEEINIPYMPPIETAERTNPPLWADDAQATPSPSSRSANVAASSSRGSGGGGELFGAGVGALLGVVFGFMTGGNPLLWGCIGAVVVGGIVALVRAIFSDDDNFWLHQFLSELTSFWPF